ncbi:MAG: response regulator, partial [Desulfobacterales bacterium]
TSKDLGWKIAFVFPAEDIDREVQGLVIRVCLALLVALALLSGLTLMGLRRFVVKPLEQLNRGAEYIAESGDLSHHIDIRSRDELGGLARSFNQMMEAIRQSESALRASEAALKQHRDHLEERVEERTEALLNSQQQMAQIIDFLPDPTFVVDNDGIVLAWNKAMEQLCGISAEEMVGRGNHEYALPFYGKRRPVLIDMVRRWEADLEGAYETLQREGKVLVSESFHPHMGDGGVYLAGTAGLLYDDEGRVAGAIESLRDISRRKQIEKELIEAKTAADEANRAKSDFLANMSHEIRTPMNAVIGMTHLALKTDLSKKQRDYLTKIRTSAEALLGIINDILDFSKIEAGKLDMESVPFNLDEVFANLADLVTVKAREKDRLEVLFHIAPDVPKSLKGDPLRLGQVLVNLAGNAVKFTDIGEIVVSAEHIGQASDRCTLRFSVKDTGIGMSREQMERLFESFTQADTSTTRKYGGTGLGLTICKRLVEMMDGSISVDSQPGGGSTFSFTAVFGIGPKTEASAHLPPPDLRGLKVLVVDDNPTSREILSTMLTAFGFETVPAPSAEEGLAELEGTAGSRPFDLVIMDWRMPGMDGIEAGRRIKNHSSLSKIPAVILITAYGRQEIIKQVEKAGFDGFLLKPVSPSVLFDAVMQAFGRITDDAARRLDPSADDGPAAPRLDGSRLLVVEDNDINRQVAQEILAGAGAVVALAENGKEALDVLARERFDAVLMDVQMPVMDGYTATRKIRQDMGLTDLPVIAMTAHAMAGDREKSLDAGMNAHINKPIDPDELVSVLRQWIPMAAPAGTGPGDPPSPSRGEAPILPDHLAGFEIDEGLKRLQGNRDLYRKLLIRFADGYAQAPDHIRTAIDGAKFDDAQRLAHTLKGVAGNLSAPDLQKTAADLEKVLKHREDLDRLPTLMGAFESSLNLAVASVRATLVSPAPPPSPEAGDPPPPVPIELAKKTAERLREAAEIGDVGEITAIVDAVAADHPAFTALRETIMVLVEDFDFEGILKTAEELSSP